MRAETDFAPFWIYDPARPEEKCRARIVKEEDSLRLVAFNLPDDRPAFLSQKQLACLFGDGDDPVSIWGVKVLGSLFAAFEDEVELIPDTILVGGHFEPSASFPTMECSIPELHDWFQYGNFSGVDRRSDGGVFDAHYEIPPALTWSFGSGMAIQYCVFMRYSHSRTPVARLELIQQSKFALVPPQPVVLSELLRYSQKFESFVEFARDCPATLEHVHVKSPNTGSDDLIYVMANWKKAGRQDFRNPYPLVEFWEVRDSLETQLDRWFSLYEAIPLALDLYRESKRTSGLHVEFRFFSMVSALESFHRTYYSPLPQTSGKPKRAPAVTLQARLEDLVVKLGPSIQDLLKKGECKSIADTRNYLAHQTPELKRKAVPSSELYYIYRRLTMVFEIAVLHQLGFSDEAFTRIIERRWRAVRTGLFGEWRF